MSEYLCPGETVPISREVHLARLANAADICLHCIHRDDTGTLPESVLRSLERCDARQPQRTNSVPEIGPHVSGGLHPALQVTESGVRGRYLNELNRATIARLTDHVGDRWSRRHLEEIGQRSDSDPSMSDARIVVGYDWRASSPDLTVAVVERLRLWGCEIVDVGRVNRPCLDLAMSALDAELGVMITGGRESDVMNGLDVVDPLGQEWPPQVWHKILHEWNRPLGRNVRRAGRFHSLAVTQLCEQRIQALFSGNHFSSDDSLRVAFACGDPLYLQTIGAALLRMNVDVIFPAVDWTNANHEHACNRFREDVRDAHVDLGIAILPDAQTVMACDERGRIFELSAVLERSTEFRFDAVPNFAQWIASAKLDSTGRLCVPGQVPSVDAAWTASLLVHLAKQVNVPLSTLNAKTHRPIS